MYRVTEEKAALSLLTKFAALNPDLPPPIRIVVFEY
jgi:hypothetical protein